jgi:hypothetical protein
MLKMWDWKKRDRKRQDQNAGVENAVLENPLSKRIESHEQVSEKLLCAGFSITEIDCAPIIAQ